MYDFDLVLSSVDKAERVEVINGHPYHVRGDIGLEIQVDPHIRRNPDAITIQPKTIYTAKRNGVTCLFDVLK